MHIVSDSFIKAMRTCPYSVRLTLDGETVIQGEAIQEITFRSGTNADNEAFTLGGTVAGTVEIALDKSQVPTLPNGCRVMVELGIELPAGTQWLPMGVYYVTEPLVDDDRLTVTASDALAAKLDREYEPIEGYDFNADAGVSSTEFLAAMCERRGVQVDTSNLEQIPLHTSPDGFTERQIVGFIAALYGGFAKVDRYGVLRICTFSKTNVKVTADDYYEDEMEKAGYTFSVQWIKCYNEISDLTMIVGDTAAQQGIYLESIWMTNAILTKLWDQLQGFSYVPVTELSFFGNPLIDAGDIIVMEDLSGTAIDVPVMKVTHEYDGGVITRVTANGQAETDSCGGSGSRQLQRVAAKARTYSGIALEEAKQYAKGLDEALNQLEVLKRLTAENVDDAIYMTKEGKLAIKATAILTGVLDASLVAVKNLVATNIVTGVLKSKDGEKFYLDLDSGDLKMNAKEFSVSGQTVDQIADGAAAAAKIDAMTYAAETAASAVNSQTQEDIFNKLFNNGKVQGFVIKDNMLYINGEYAEISNLVAEAIVAGKLTSKSGTTYFDLDNDEITTSSSTGFRDALRIQAGSLKAYDSARILRVMLATTAKDGNSGMHFFKPSGNLSGFFGTIDAPDPHADNFVISLPEYDSGTLVTARPYWRDVVINGENVKIICGMEVSG